MDIKECGNCGARYKLTRHKSIMRDKDRILCNHCVAIIISWNGGHFYTDEEISGPTKDFKKD